MEIWWTPTIICQGPTVKLQGCIIFGQRRVGLWVYFQVPNSKKKCESQFWAYSNRMWFETLTPRNITKHQQSPLVGGWTNPIWKIWSSNWIIFPNFRDENEKYLRCHHLVIRGFSNEKTHHSRPSHLQIGLHSSCNGSQGFCQVKALPPFLQVCERIKGERSSGLLVHPRNIPIYM